MFKEYNFLGSGVEKGEEFIPVVNVCDVNGVESGLPKEEQGVNFINKNETVILYAEALTNNTADPIFVGMPHAGEFVSEEIFKRISEPKAFADGLDKGTAAIFSPLPGEKYLAVRNRISRLVADPNRGVEQFNQTIGVGGVTWKNNLQGQPIYKNGENPTDDEIAKNVDNFHTPYYRKLHAALASLHEKMGYKNILFLDAHSFPDKVDIPQIGLKGDELKPMFIVGSQGSARASEDVKRIFTDALVRYAPDKAEFPEMYERISEIVHEETEFGWGGARNVVYFGHPEGVNSENTEKKDEDFKIHAIQLEMNMAAFYKEGKYNHQHLEAMKKTMQKVLEEVGNKIKKL
jgi:N-formylglutamate amidohydrolase